MELILAATIIAMFLPLIRMRSPRLSDAALVFALAFFCGGVFIAFVAGRGLPVVHNQRALVLTYVAIAVYAAGLWSGGRVATRVFGCRESLRDACTGAPTTSASVLLLLFAVVWAFRIARIAFFGVTFSGVTAFDLKKVPYLFGVGVELSDWLAPGLLVFAAIVRSPRLRTAYLIVFGELAWAVLDGRRAVMFWFVVIALASFVRTGKMPRLRVACTAAVGMCIVYYGSVWFLPARAAAADTRQRSAAESIVAGVSQGNRSVIDGSSEEHARQNWATRPLISRFVTEVIEATDEGRDFLGGAALARDAFWVIPSVFGQKPLLQTEQLIQASFGIPLSDTSITWLVVGYADFGLLGAFLYSFLFSATLAVIVHLMGHTRFCLLLKMCVFGGVLALAFNIEEDPLYLFVFIRDSVLILLAAFLLRIATQSARRKFRIPACHRSPNPARPEHFNTSH